MRSARHRERPWRGKVHWVSPETDYRPDGFTPPRVALIRKDDGTLYAAMVSELLLGSALKLVEAA